MSTYEYKASWTFNFSCCACGWIYSRKASGPYVRTMAEFFPTSTSNYKKKKIVHCNARFSGISFNVISAQNMLIYFRLYILGIACIFNRGVNASKANPIKVALSYCTSITEQTTAKSYVFLRYCTAKPVVRKLYWQQLFLERASSMCSRFSLFISFSHQIKLEEILERCGSRNFMSVPVSIFLGRRNLGSVSASGFLGLLLGVVVPVFIFLALKSMMSYETQE